MNIQPLSMITSRHKSFRKDFHHFFADNQQNSHCPTSGKKRPYGIDDSGLDFAKEKGFDARRMDDIRFIFLAK